MEPNTTYRPPFYLGDKFIDGHRRKFEIIETHWGLPGTETKQTVCATIELHNGHRINFYGPPHLSVLKEVGFREEGKSNKHTTQPVDVLQKLIVERKIVMT